MLFHEGTTLTATQNKGILIDFTIKSSH